MPKEYRTRARVLQEILAALQSAGSAGVGITRLTAGVNLTHQRIQEHLSGFESNGLVERDGASSAWRITPKGSLALEELRRIDRAMKDFGIGL